MPTAQAEEQGFCCLKSSAVQSEIVWRYALAQAPGKPEMCWKSQNDSAEARGLSTSSKAASIFARVLESMASACGNGEDRLDVVMM